MSGIVLLFKISENIVEGKQFKTSAKLCACLIVHLPNLHTILKRHVLKLEFFLRTSIFLFRKIQVRVAFWRT